MLQLFIVYLIICQHKSIGGLDFKNINIFIW